MRSLQVLKSFVFVLFVASTAAAQIELRASPCRLYDSRGIGAGNKLTSSANEDITTRGAAGNSQGGETGCGAPPTAMAVVVNIVLLSPESTGWARFFPQGGTEPLATTVNASASVANEANSAILLVGDNGEITLHMSITASHVIIDLVGWVDGSGESREHTNPSYVVGPRFRRFLTTTNAPIGGLSPGDRFLVAASGTVGPLVGHENEWMYWDGSTWVFEKPLDGDLAYESATGKYFGYRASFDTWNELLQ